MTTLISWLAVDSRGPSALYLASDSRISWDRTGSSTHRWDVGIKLFASNNQPEIFGYCGDVTFPNQILHQVCNQIDIGMLFAVGESFESKLAKVESMVNSGFQRYPQDHKRDFQVLYASRINEGMKAHFCIAKIYGNSKGRLEAKILQQPEYSSLIDGVGTGAVSVREWYKRWQNSDVSRTSRSVFSAFCESIQSGEDKLSGGAPQLLGIYRTGAAKVFGVIFNGKRYVSGHEAHDLGQLEAIEWRNVLFERCDPHSMKLLPKAQPQPRPNNMR